MQNDTSKFYDKYTIPMLILIGFTMYFAYDIFNLKKAFVHPDFITYYYSYRQWFSQRLLSGEFPLWNPFWGIGQPTDIWATIPIDIYTILEIIFGPQYHYFQVIQLILILLAGFYVFLKLGFKPTISASGIILYFMTPWVTYFYFYFMKPHSFIGNMLIFFFVYGWFKTENFKYLFFLIWTVILSMFGTKPEYWFFNITLYVFYSATSVVLFYRNNFLRSFKLFSLSLLSLFIGILAHLWQLNILGRIINDSGRTPDHSFLNLFSYEMYYNLFLSIAESSLLKMIGVGFLFYLGVDARRQFLRVFLLLFGMIALFKFKIWKFQEIISFVNSPLLIGAAVGALLSLIRQKFLFPFSFIISIRYYYITTKLICEQIKTGLLFLLLVYYWCRPGTFSEIQIMASAPVAFKILLSALVWLGCMQFWKSKLAKLAYFSILFVFLMREHGQIFLAYLSGLLWMSTRDNYIIDFAVAVLAVIGLSTLDIPNVFKNGYKRQILAATTSFIVIGIIILSASSNLYYSHFFMEKSPIDYPYYTGVPKLRKIVHELRESPTTRIFFLRHDPLSHTYGFGDTLLEGVSQVTLYASTIPKRYRDWAIYKELGIRPDEKWGAYPDGYTEKMISMLPKRNTLGYPNGPIYYFTVLTRPPVEKNALRLLGIEYIIRIFHKSDEMVYTLDPKTWGLKSNQPVEIFIDELVRNLDLKDVKVEKIKEFIHRGEEGLLLTAKSNNPLPRAFLASGIAQSNIAEFMNEMSPVISDNNDSIKTKSFVFQLDKSANIEKYEPENVTVKVEAKEDSYLILSDLYHPFWHARLNGEDVDIIPAFYILRAVKVPAGIHRIDFYYNVPYFKASIIISFSTILLTIIAFLLFKFTPMKFNAKI